MRRAFLRRLSAPMRRGGSKITGKNEPRRHPRPGAVAVGDLGLERSERARRAEQFLEGAQRRPA